MRGPRPGGHTMGANRPRKLSRSTAATLLRENGVIPGGREVETRPLGGGVSNRVFQVRWDGECLVLKQPRPNLAVEDDWPADVQRVHNEAAATRAFRTVIDQAGLDARVPRIVFESTADHLVAMECAPEDTVMWKRQLLDGRVDADVAAILGEVLAAVHEASALDEELREQFASKRPFHQLRLDPYHRSTAARHPDVAAHILAEADRIAGVERTLVHGDYSPKNVLVERSNGAVPWILDFEVAHWGDPAFDPAFMLNHVLIKSVYNHGAREAYHGAALTFWESYRDGVPWDVESETVTEVGVLMLARVDGKSPVEYVEEGPIAETLRRIAKRTLLEPVRGVDRLLEVADREATGV